MLFVFPEEEPEPLPDPFEPLPDPFELLPDPLELLPDPLELLPDPPPEEPPLLVCVLPETLFCPLIPVYPCPGRS